MRFLHESSAGWSLTAIGADELEELGRAVGAVRARAARGVTDDEYRATVNTLALMADNLQ